MNLTRRLFFGAATAAAVAPVSKALPASTLPLTSPAEYLAEMRAIGWSPVASVYRGEPQHVIEYGPEDEFEFDNSWSAFARLQWRIDPDSLDFWPRVSRYLFDLGLREDVGPGRSRKARARASS